MQKKTVAYLKLLTAIILWAGVYHVAKYLVRDTDVASVAFIRFLCASIILFAIYCGKKRSMAIRVSGKSLILLGFIGFFGVAAYTILFFAAEKLIAADDVAILYAFTPCIAVIFGVFILKNKINLLQCLGIAVALFGTVGVLSLSSLKCGRIFCPSLFNDLSWGQLMAISAAACMAMYSILNKKAILMGLDSITITTFGAIFGTVILWINFLISGDKLSLLLHKPLSFWLAMLYVSILATVVGYKWYIDAVSEIEMEKVVVFLNGVPFCAILIGLFINGTGISIYEFISGCVIVLGVLITNYAGKKCTSK